jgi:hypothetical protein
MPLLTRFRAAGFACTLTLAAGTSAAAPLLKLDSPQKAASAIVASSFIEHEATGVLQIITAPAQEYALLALTALAASTTPGALAQTNGGMTFACRAGGNFIARSTPSAPRVVDIEFAGCLPYRFFNSTADGPLRLTLLSNSFAADRLAGIRLGARDRDFVVVVQSLTPEQNTLSTINHNLTMQGLIDVPRDQQADGVAATSLYEITGFTSQRDRFEIPGRDVLERTVRNAAEHLLVSTSFTFENDFLLYDEDMKLLWGSLANTVTEPTGEYRKRFEVAGLRVHRVTNFKAWTDTLTLDGAVRFTWPSQSPSGCLSGGYLFDTRTPLRRANLDSAALDSGDLVINGDVRMRAYAPGSVPPGLPEPALGMLLNVNVRGVGAFNFDVEALNGPTMWATAGCP